MRGERRGSYDPGAKKNKPPVDKSKRRLVFGLGIFGAGAAMGNDGSREVMVDVAKMGWRALLKRFDDVAGNGEDVERQDGGEGKKENPSLRGYDNILGKEFAHFAKTEQERGGDFDYEDATMYALKSEKYHLWDARVKALSIGDLEINEETSQEIYYRELLNKDKEERKEFLEKTTEICKEFDVPVSVALGVMMTESGAKHKVKKRKGEVLSSPQGIMQITASAEDLVRRVFGKKVEKATRGDMWGNVTLGVAYLKLMHGYYGNQWGLACKAYSSSISVTDSMIMEEMSTDFKEEYAEKMKDPKRQKDMSPWDFKRREINKFLQESNTNIVKAYYPKDKGGWGWNDDKNKHSVQYPFFVFINGHKAYGILNSPEDPPQVGQFFTNPEEKLECQALREGKPTKVAKL
jgi:hypothetical protein